MIYRFEFSDFEGFQDLETFYRLFAVCLLSANYERIVLDLRRVRFLMPEALLCLLCASKVWSAERGSLVEWQMNDDDVLRYLERMQVFNVFSDCISVTPLPADLWSRGVSLNVMEVKAIANDPEQNSIDVPSILAIAQTLLIGRVTPVRMGAACTLLSEVAQNVTHSGSRGYALMQVYKAGARRRVHIGVADVGIGIPTSLCSKYPDAGYSSDYLKLSLEPGISSRDVGNGLGLYQVQHLVRNEGGTLVIRSDTAMLQIYDGRVYQWDGLAHFPGTQVFITMWGQHEHGKWNYLLPTK